MEQPTQDLMDVTTDRRVEQEHLSMVLRGVPAMALLSAIAAILASALVAYLKWDSSVRLPLLAWLGCLLICLAIVTLTARRFVSGPQTYENVKRYSDRNRLLATVVGGLWGSPAFFVLPGLPLEHQAIVLVGLAMVLIGSALSMTTESRTSGCFASAMVGVLTLGMLRLGNAAYVFVAAGFIILAALQYSLARALERKIKASIALGFEKNELLIEAETQRKRADEARSEAEAHAQQLSESIAALKIASRRVEEERQRAEEQTKLLLQSKEEQRRQAVRSNQEKSRFLASAAHDLKQPMQAVGAVLEALNHAAMQGDLTKVQELLVLARRATKAMRTSFGAVLEISRLESGFVKAQYSHFDLNELVSEYITSLKPFADSRGVKLRSRSHLRKTKAYVRSDRELLGRVIANIVTNAVKYSDPNKEGSQTVLVNIAQTATKVRLDVVDNGLGIARDSWNDIFVPFFQLGNQDRDREKGMGLGLSIVNAIVSILDEHRLELNSKVSKGTRISIELPVGISDLAMPLEIDTEQGTLDVARMAGLYVWLVEDDVLVRDTTAALFNQWNILYEMVPDVTTLKQLCAGIQRCPDVVVSDYRLPDHKTASDVVRIVREEFGADVPVLVVTGEVALSSWEDNLEGIDVLQKPVAPQVLLKKLSEAANLALQTAVMRS